MDVKLLKTDILINNIPKFLIFAAYEPTLCKQYIVSISNTLGLDYSFYNNADAAIVDITNNIKKDIIYVIFNDQKIIKNPEYADKLSKLDKYIIVYFNELDKTSSFYKTNKELIVSFEKLDKFTILAYLQKKCNAAKVDVDQAKLLTLIDYCNCNLGECLNELDKILVLAQEHSNVLVDYMLNNGFSDYRQTNVFNFITKILNKDKSVFDDKQRLVDSNMTILYNLYNQSKQRFLKSRDSYCVKCMKLSSRVFNGVVDGTIADAYALDYVLFKLLIEEEDLPLS